MVNNLQSGFFALLTILFLFTPFSKAKATSMTDSIDPKVYGDELREKLLKAKTIFLAESTKIGGGPDYYLKVTKVLKGKADQKIIKRRFDCRAPALPKVEYTPDSPVLIIFNSNAESICDGVSLRHSFYRKGFQEALKKGLKLNSDVSEKEIKKLLQDSSYK